MSTGPNAPFEPLASIVISGRGELHENPYVLEMLELLAMASDLPIIWDLPIETRPAINPFRVLQISTIRADVDPEMHLGPGHAAQVVFYRPQTGEWRLAHLPEWTTSTVLVDQILEWLTSTPEVSSTAIAERVEELCGWIDRLLTRNALLERFLDEARQQARHNLELRADLAELEKELEETRLQLQALSIEPKKKAVNTATASLATRALTHMVSMAAGAAITFAATYAGVVAAPSGVSQRDLTEQLAQVRAEVEHRGDTIINMCEPHRATVEPNPPSNDLPPPWSQGQ